MKTISYYTQDKSKWGPGAWQNEPDKKQWLDPETGYPCLIVRAEVTGALCGYVGVSTSNKMFGKDYNDADVDVHGGLTFAGFCHENFDQSRGICHTDENHQKVWWQGFDCAHAWDLSPAMRAKMHEIMGFRQPYIDETYRDFDYVTKQVTELAAQLKKYETKKNIKNRLMIPILMIQHTKWYRRISRKILFSKMKRWTKQLQSETDKMRKENEQKTQNH